MKCITTDNKKCVMPDMIVSSIFDSDPRIYHTVSPTNILIYWFESWVCDEYKNVFFLGWYIGVWFCEVI